MAHHLAALITAAEDDNTTTEQRIEIVETILKVWAERRSYPGDVPAYEIDLVFSALDMLGDERPWRFSRLRNLTTGLPNADDADVPFVVMAVNLERLTREALLALIWRECQNAIAKNEHWLEAAEAIGASIEDELTTNARRINRRLLDLTGDQPLNPNGPEDTDSVRAEVLTRRLRAMSAELASLADDLARDAEGS